MRALKESVCTYTPKQPRYMVDHIDHYSATLASVYSEELVW